jgi:hypothetical protein
MNQQIALNYATYRHTPLATGHSLNVLNRGANDCEHIHDEKLFPRHSAPPTGGPHIFGSHHPHLESISSVRNLGSRLAVMIKKTIKVKSEAIPVTGRGGL